ncbi:hypothetical protein Pth03_81760 [Planotetraspora thailandica]|uniref:DUF732 domain-containing protein n=1 Tax=Planotetraspora thailandica TaxID=487172 RepID=A0A8J3Y313_9ACTN|nr:hypothetical protein [Planotetraspora thailandica]GII59787.1 hypothetical protein Pth03_81760 [Planotetraspora thailandica]
MDHEQDPPYIRVGYPPNAPPNNLHKAVNRTALVLLISAIVLLVAVLVVWAATQPDLGKPDVLAVPMSAPSSPSTGPSASVRDLTATERRFANAVRKDTKVDGVTGDLELVRKGRLFCRLERDPASPYTWAMNVEGIHANKASLGVPERDAVRYLCPKYAAAWRQGMAAFGEGDQKVGADVQPGRYRTYDRDVKDCSWKRTAGGQTVSSATVPAASGGVTVTIRATDARFTSTGCGLWVPIL